MSARDNDPNGRYTFFGGSRGGGGGGRPGDGPPPAGPAGRGGDVFADHAHSDRRAWEQEPTWRGPGAAASPTDSYCDDGHNVRYDPQAELDDGDDSDDGGNLRVSSYFPLKHKEPRDEAVPLSPRRYRTADAGGVAATAETAAEYPAAPYVPDTIAGWYASADDENIYSSNDHLDHDGISSFSPGPAAGASSRQRNQPELGRASSDAALPREFADDDTTLRSQDYRYGGEGVGRSLSAAGSNQIEENRELPQEPPGKEQSSTKGKSVGGLADNIPKVLRKPKVAKQYARRAAVTYRPYFVWLVTLAQVAMVAVSFFINNKQTGSFVEALSLNPMIGPSSTTLIGMGARFTPCMRPLAAFNSTVVFSCPASLAQATCNLEDICGFGGFKSGQPDQWFRFIIPIFLHAGVIHLLFNMMFQARTGMDMEREMGALRFGAIYMVSGLAGNVFGANFAPVKQQSVGASSALFGLIGCLLLDLLQNWKLISRPVWELAKMLLMIAFSFVLGLLPGFDNFAHIGGFLGGFISGLIFLPRIHFGKWDRRLKIGAVVVAVPLLVTLYALAVKNFYRSENPSDSCSWCRYLSCLPVHGWCDAFDDNGA